VTWWAIAALAVGSYGFKLGGVIVGNRLGATRLRGAIALLPPALFCALIALQTFARDSELAIDARVVGVIAAVIATARRVPFAGVIMIAMAATALTRLIAS
jgi:uncharacterized membrane protein